MQLKKEPILITHGMSNVVSFGKGGRTTANHPYMYLVGDSVELIGNYAFSKPLIAALAPDAVIIFTSEVNKPRNEVIAKRVFAGDLPYEFNVITGEHSDNEVLVAKERDATTLFEAVFEHVEDGDDAAFRTTLLYKTPYYFKGIIDDKDFFDTYWQGGFENYISAREARKKL